jgi:hypothetical protein
MNFNEQHHIGDVSKRLERLLPDGSLAKKMKAQIGRELSAAFSSDADDELAIESNKLSGLDEFVWALLGCGGWRLGWEEAILGSLQFPELVDFIGPINDDEGNQIPVELLSNIFDEPACNPAQLLALYGLHFVERELDSFGAVPNEGQNDQGFDRENVLQHRASCLLIAYSALAHAHEVLGLQRSKLAVKGSDAIHRENRALKDLVFQWCDANSSLIPGNMDNVAHDLTAAGKVSLVPVKFSTVRAWLTDWKKEQNF